ncbi:putative protein OS=Ureibacillus acetophenoni OX=614649 GN=SAMN05877842_10356 PE=4 SV=1 [Ureibacillus acetophenoni]
MNEMKRSLIEVAGDMSESKDRVRKRLLERHEKKDYYWRTTWRFLYEW